MNPNYKPEFKKEYDKISKLLTRYPPKESETNKINHQQNEQHQTIEEETLPQLPQLKQQEYQQYQQSFQRPEMKENETKTGAYFVIPSSTKVLYVYRLKVKDIKKEIRKK